MHRAALDEVPTAVPRPPGWVVDAVLAVLVVAAAFAPMPVDGLRPTSPLTWVVILLPAVVLPLRRRWPIPVLAVVILLFAIAAVSGTYAPGLILALLVAVFGAATRTSRRSSLIITAATVVAVAAVSVFAVLRDELSAPLFQIVILVAAAAAVGDAARWRREYIVAITDRARRAEETREAEAQRRVSEERLRIARDLHDTVAHQISVISLNAGVASAALDTRPETARDALATIRSASRSVLTEIGDLLAVLRDRGEPGPTGGTAVVLAPQLRLAQLDSIIESVSSTGMQVSVTVHGDLAAIPAAVDGVAARVVQEGLTNAMKHGSGASARVLIDVGADAVEVVVTNPIGGGGAGDAPSGFGLLGLRERVAAVRGTMESGVAPGGFRLAAVLPTAVAP